MVDYSQVALVRSMSYLADSQAAIAHNLANVNTNGFKKRIPVPVSEGSFASVLGRQMPTMLYSEFSNWEQGTLRQTGSRFQIAIEGEGLLRVRDSSGNILYTRNGTLSIDFDGYLTTSTGHRYLDQNGEPIQMLGDDGPVSSFTIAPDGSISDDATGADLGQLRLVGVADKSRLQPTGKGLYHDSAAQPADVEVTGTLRQGFTEGSNVSSIDELVRMLQVQRIFQANQRALSSLNRLQTSYLQMMSR